jgi:hypothetical protein
MPQDSRSKLFVSCDLVGSTHFKQTQKHWQKVFLSFYREFPQFVARANIARSADADREALAFHLWKAVGDELIFEVHVRSEEEVGLAVRVWLDAMREYEDQSLAEFKLALKGGAFVATFPGPDSESTIPREPMSEDSDDSVVLLNDQALKGQRSLRRFHYDYFGPSIDTGFRVFGLSSRRYFTLSVEAAMAVATAAHSASATKEGEATHNVNDVVLHGTHVLKGVWAGREYPVFAVDRDLNEPINIALAKLQTIPMMPSQIIDVCHACLQDAAWPSSLYLPDSNNASFGIEPADAMRELREAEVSLSAEPPADSENTEGQMLEEGAPLG